MATLDIPNDVNNKHDFSFSTKKKEESEQEQKPEPEPKQEPEPKPEQKLEPEPEPKQEPEPKPEQKLEPEQKPKQEQEQEPEPEQEPKLEPEQANLSDQTKKLLLSLPKIKSWLPGHVYFFQGFWCKPQQIQAALRAQAQFLARESDVVVTTLPKSGTTWLKALVFAITQRARHPPSRSDPAHPLLANNPHDLVPFLEYKVYAGPVVPDLDGLSSPRLVATHVPYGVLPDSVRSSACKIVYICRNPLDTFVSTWEFIKKARQEISPGALTMEEAFDMYCKGEMAFGPYWDHMLSYWNEGIRSPDKVMFLKYEDMKRDAGFAKIKELAHFLGYGFSAEEEREGVVEEVARLCSFETMKDLAVNKKGNSVGAAFHNESLFRKAEVGDYANHLSKEMIDRLNKVTEEKLAGSGLRFTV